MQAIGQPGVKGVCFACQEDAKPKTGKTVVVTSESGEGTALGKVTFKEVDHNPGQASALPKDPNAVRKAIMDKAKRQTMNPELFEKLDKGLDQTTPLDEVIIRTTISHLSGNVIENLLDAAFEAIDNMPPGTTLKETKRMIQVQDKISALLYKYKSKGDK